MHRTEEKTTDSVTTTRGSYGATAASQSMGQQLSWGCESSVSSSGLQIAIEPQYQTPNEGPEEVSMRIAIQIILLSRSVKCWLLLFLLGFATNIIRQDLIEHFNLG